MTVLFSLSQPSLQLGKGRTGPTCGLSIRRGGLQDGGETLWESFAFQMKKINDLPGLSLFFSSLDYKQNVWNKAAILWPWGKGQEKKAETLALILFRYRNNLSSHLPLAFLLYRKQTKKIPLFVDVIMSQLSCERSFPKARLTDWMRFVRTNHCGSTGEGSAKGEVNPFCGRSIPGQEVALESHWRALVGVGAGMLWSEESGERLWIWWVGGHSALCWDFRWNARDRHLFTLTQKRAGRPAGTSQCEERHAGKEAVWVEVWQEHTGEWNSLFFFFSSAGGFYMPISCGWGNSGNP